jgi:hypothetical protein
VGKKVLKSLQDHTRVVCGYATVKVLSKIAEKFRSDFQFLLKFIKDVRTMQLEDRMDSFVLAETFKYLYLLFANPSDLVVDIENFVFTTEGHLLPLSLARLSNRTAVPVISIMVNKNFLVRHNWQINFVSSSSKIRASYTMRMLNSILHVQALTIYFQETKISQNQ